MARPFKQGVDYFPLDVHLDNKFKFIEIKFGLKGFAVVIKMIQNIYSQSYWMKWGEDEKILFASENKIDFNEVESITSECVKRDIFNLNLYEQHEILTSKGIQTRYKEIVRRRKEVEMTEEYLLIEGFTKVNDVINPTLGQLNEVKSTQSKVKESKVNKIKEKKVKYADYVSMKEEEYEKLIEQFGEIGTKDRIENLNLYKGSNGKKYKDDYLTILAWERKNNKNNPQQPTQRKKLKLGDD